MAKPRPNRSTLHLQRNLITGVITIIPLWITWLLFEFVFNQLSDVGMPWVRLVAQQLDDIAPSVSMLLLSPWFQRLISLVLVLIALYVLGLGMNRVVGQRLFGVFEQVLQRLPFVQAIYGSVKKLIAVLQKKPDGVQRVVLVNFPHKDMKVVGLATRTMKDASTGETLVAVYVPTTPNPTSGYLEIVPIDQVTSTDWTMDEAMNFIISGGAIAPDTINYRAGPPSAASIES